MRHSSRHVQHACQIVQITSSCGSCQASLPCQAPGLRPWPVLRECQPAYEYPASKPPKSCNSQYVGASYFQTRFGVQRFQEKRKLTLASAPACSPHAFITKASLTDTQAMTWAPASVSLAKSFTYPGRCVCRHISENCQPQHTMQRWDKKSRDFDDYLGAAWGEGAWYAEQYPFLSLEDVCQLHVLVWSPFLQLDLRQRASSLCDNSMIQK